MKLLAHALCLGIVSLFFSSSARSGTFSITDNFDGLASDAFITDAPNWTTTDLWQNNGVIPHAGGQAGWIGGLYDGPTTTTTYLTRSFDAQDNNRFTFRWTQNIANATSDDGVRDKFGWSVKSTTGGDLLTLIFDNTTFIPGQNLLAKGYSGSLSGTLQSSTGLGVSNRGEWAQFEIVLDTAANSWTASLFNAAANEGTGAWQTFIQNGAVNGTGYTVGGIAAVWDLADTSTTRTDTLIDETEVSLYTSAGKIS